MPGAPTHPPEGARAVEQGMSTLLGTLALFLVRRLRRVSSAPADDAAATSDAINA